VGAEIFTNFWCFVHNFGYRYARKLFKGSKDEDFGLVSKKTLEPKEWPNGLGSRTTQKWPKKIKNTPTCGGPPENSPPKAKNFFFNFN